MVMAVVGHRGHSRQIMAFHTPASSHNAILAAASTVPYFTPVVSPSEMQPDRPIGYGAFGVVWAVTDPRDGKRVALKKMPNVFQNLISADRKSVV